MRASCLSLLALLAAAAPAVAQTAAPSAPAPAAAPASPAAGASRPAVAVPADEAHVEAAALFEATGGSVMMGKVLDMIRGQFSAILAQGGKTPADAARVFDEVLMPEFKERLPELRPAMIEIWADNFTVDELRGLHAFYDTPLGRKVLEKQPVLAQQAVAVGGAWGQRVAQDALRHNADELRRRGVKL